MCMQSQRKSFQEILGSTYIIAYVSMNISVKKMKILCISIMFYANGTY